jgi:hypothetical protein
VAGGSEVATNFKRPDTLIKCAGETIPEVEYEADGMVVHMVVVRVCVLLHC